MRKFLKRLLDRRSKEDYQNISELDTLLKMFHKQTLIGHLFNEDYTELTLDFEDFVITIDLKRAKWNQKDMRVFPSPILGRMEWKDGPRT